MVSCEHQREAAIARAVSHSDKLAPMARRHATSSTFVDAAWEMIRKRFAGNGLDSTRATCDRLDRNGSSVGQLTQ
jgi:hypothetical protein